MKTIPTKKPHSEEGLNYLELNLRLPYMIDDFIELTREEEPEEPVEKEK